jgi:hypothetical protein
MKTRRQKIKDAERKLDNNVRRAESFGKKTKTRKFFMKRVESARCELRKLCGW